MAKADYKLCDLCGEKAFYDSNLNYEHGLDAPGRSPFREAGKPQLQDPTLDAKHGMRLDNLGDWAVLCGDCSMTHKTAIVPIGGESP